MSKAWTSLEHQVWKLLKELSLESHEKFILAVSGGLDSMVLLEVFLNLKPRAELKVAYYHHGSSKQKQQEEFRNQALGIVKQKIQNLNKNNVHFYTEMSSVELLSENEMRNSRWNFLRSLVQPDEIIVTAHHLDDRLETMLLKMIRGTSIDGFSSFQIWNQQILRPFLETPKSDLLIYAQEAQLSWIEDPSNMEEHYLRNWMREKWLKDLDDKVPSGCKNLAKSLLRINQAIGENQPLELKFGSSSDSNEILIIDTLSINRQWFVSLTKADQLRSLALFLKKHQMYKFTTGQLEEIRKRLDKNQKDITFEILGRKWVINATQIMLG